MQMLHYVNAIKEHAFVNGKKNNGEVKCFYKKGPDKCCFEIEETKAILEKSKS